MIYGKIIDDKIKFLSDKTKRFTDDVNHLVVINPQKANFIKAGYIKLVKTEKPKDVEYCYSTWQIVNGKITCVWVEYDPEEV